MSATGFVARSVRPTLLTGGFALLLTLSAPLAAQSPEPTTPDAVSAPASPTAAGVAAGPPLAASGLEGASEQGFEPSLHLKIFSDVNFEVKSRENAAFRLGGVDFFLTGDLSEQVSALSESVLEILNGDSKLDLERLYLEWHPRAWLQVRFGRDHVMLGRYMQTYHHALLLQMATERPLLFAFEDEGGLLPAHQTGVEVKGDVPLPGVVLHYALGLGNGRGQYADDVLSTFDRDGVKSRLAQLSVLPDFAPGLELGISGYWDQIPAGYTDAAGNVLIPRPLHEYIASAHAAYLAYPIDAQAEGYWLWHTDNAAPSTSMLGGFLQLGWELSDWGPYARLEAITRDAEDAFFNISAAPTRLLDLRGGLRYSLAEQAILKAEYGQELHSNTKSFTIQAAFGVP